MPAANLTMHVNTREWNAPSRHRSGLRPAKWLAQNHPPVAQLSFVYLALKRKENQAPRSRVDPDVCRVNDILHRVAWIRTRTLWSLAFVRAPCSSGQGEQAHKHAGHKRTKRDEKRKPIGMVQTGPSRREKVSGEGRARNHRKSPDRSIQI